MGRCTTRENEAPPSKKVKEMVTASARPKEWRLRTEASSQLPKNYGDQCGNAGAGMAQETGKLLAWRKKEGERVTKGEALLEIETDKDSCRGGSS